MLSVQYYFYPTAHAVSSTLLLSNNPCCLFNITSIKQPMLSVQYYFYPTTHAVCSTLLLSNNPCCLFNITSIQQPMVSVQTSLLSNNPCCLLNITIIQQPMLLQCLLTAVSRKRQTRYRACVTHSLFYMKTNAIQTHVKLFHDLQFDTNRIRNARRYDLSTKYVH